LHVVLYIDRHKNLKGKDEIHQVVILNVKFKKMTSI
jgi:hypothetical protein